MTATCWSSLRGRVARFTKLDACCTPLAPLAACGSLTTKGFISVEYSPEISEAEEIEVKNAGGEICVTDPGCDELKWINLVITLCNVDPDLLTFVTGSPVVLDADGNGVGNRFRTGQACSINFGMEVWTDVPAAQCSVAGGKQYGYFLTPCVGSGIIGDFTIENDALSLTINAKARSGSGWGVGPYLVDDEGLGAIITPSPLLTPIGALDVLDMHLTTIAPPTPVCGCVAMPAAIV